MNALNGGVKFIAADDGRFSRDVSEIKGVIGGNGKTSQKVISLKLKELT
jgi:hypothetical protein